MLQDLYVSTSYNIASIVTFFLQQCGVFVCGQNSDENAAYISYTK